MPKTFLIVRELQRHWSTTGARHEGLLDLGLCPCNGAEIPREVMEVVGFGQEQRVHARARDTTGSS